MKFRNTSKANKGSLFAQSGQRFNKGRLTLEDPDYEPQNRRERRAKEAILRKQGNGNDASHNVPDSGTRDGSGERSLRQNDKEEIKERSRTTVSSSH